MSNHFEQVRTSFVFVLPGPGLVHELGGFDSTVILELEQGQLSSYLDWVILEKKEWFGIVAIHKTTCELTFHWVVL